MSRAALILHLIVCSKEKNHPGLCVGFSGEHLLNYIPRAGTQQSVSVCLPCILTAKKN